MSAVVIEVGIDLATLGLEIVGHLLAYVPVHIGVTRTMQDEELGLLAGLPVDAVATEGVLLEYLYHLLADVRVEVLGLRRQDLAHLAISSRFLVASNEFVNLP